jgi:hypothetical protein
VTKTLLKDAFGWGFLLWFIGYLLGILLFAVVSPQILGWVIMPIGIVITVWVLLTKVKRATIMEYMLLSVVWTLIAVIFDYFFLVKVFKPTDGYYKLDVYIYYSLTFILPLVIGLNKSKKVIP